MKNMTTPEKEPIIVSSAIPADAEAIAHVVSTTWLSTYPNEELGITKEDIEERVKNRQSPEELEKTRRRIVEGKPNQKAFVAKELETVVGFCSVIKEPEFNQLKAIYILPEYQGQGVGQKLWAQTLEFFSDNKNKIIVQVATYNQQAIGFYKKLGFRETGKLFSDERFRMKSGSIIPETELVIERE